METILVTGASGNLGSAVVDALAGEGFNVRAASRRTAKIRSREHVRPALFDYEDHGLYRSALDGVAGVFLIAPPLDSRAPEKLNPFIDMAKDMGIGHVVFNSAFKADRDEKNPLRIIERHLMESGIGWTILRPNFFMENFSTGWAAPMIASAEISMAAGAGRTSFISVEDIARAAAACFREKRSGSQFNLTGPEALSHGDVARILSGTCGKPVTYRPLSEAELMKNARKQGMPESSIRYLVQLFAMVRKGLMAETTGEVHRLTGKAPVSFEEFARKNAEVCKMQKAA